MREPMLMADLFESVVEDLGVVDEGLVNMIKSIGRRAKIRHRTKVAAQRKPIMRKNAAVADKLSKRSTRDLEMIAQGGGRLASMAKRILAQRDSRRSRAS